MKKECPTCATTLGSCANGAVVWVVPSDDQIRIAELEAEVERLTGANETLMRTARRSDADVAQFEAEREYWQDKEWKTERTYLLSKKQELEADVERLRTHIDRADGDGVNLADLLDLYHARKTQAEMVAIGLRTELAAERAKNCAEPTHGAVDASEVGG